MFEDFTVLKEEDDEEMRGPAKRYAQVPSNKLDSRHCSYYVMASLFEKKSG